jgi:hypothetical protein
MSRTISEQQRRLDAKNALAALAQLRTLITQAAIFTALVPALWWLLPCPQDHAATTLVFITACFAGGSWLAVCLACLAIACEEFGTQWRAFTRRAAWGLIELLTCPGDFFRRK